MIFERLKSGLVVSDEAFDEMYNKRLKKVSEFHFTPVEVARAAARFLVRMPGDQVLDIGAGAGKFCMVGASCAPGFFVGVEQRKYLFQTAQKLAQTHQVEHVKFIHANITDIDFKSFDAVYFFNAFYENLFPNDPLDHAVALDKPLYQLYSQYVKDQLFQMPLGTRLATYFSFLDEVPDGYEIRETHFDGKLKFWEKMA